MKPKQHAVTHNYANGSVFLYVSSKAYKHVHTLVQGAAALTVLTGLTFEANNP